MLGRYVAGTLLILGGAMMVAPDAPKKPVVQVTRAETSPVALSAPRGADEQAAVVVKASVDVMAPAEEQSDEIENAVLAALQLDSGEDASGERRSGLADVPEGTDATAPERVVWQGLSALSQDADNAEPVLANDAQVAAVDPAKLLFVTGTKVNVRSGPSTDYRVVGSVSRGDEVELLSGNDETWAEIRVSGNGTTGFMSRKFLASALNGG